MTNGWSLAAHFGDGERRRVRHRRRPHRRDRQGPGAGPRRLARVPRDRRQGAQGLERPLPRRAASVDRVSVTPSSASATTGRARPRSLARALDGARARRRCWSRGRPTPTTIAGLAARRGDAAAGRAARLRARRARAARSSTRSPSSRPSGRRCATRSPHDVPVRFIDLPAAHWLAARARRARRDARTRCAPTRSAVLAEAAGYEDAERWWEDVVEQRRDELDGVRGGRRGDGARCARGDAARDGARGAARGAHAARDPRRRRRRASSASPWSAAPGTSPALGRAWPTAAADAALLQGPASRRRSPPPGCRGPTTGSPTRAATAPASLSPGWYRPPLHAPRTTSSSAGSRRPPGCCAPRTSTSPPPHVIEAARDWPRRSPRCAGRPLAGLPELVDATARRARRRARTSPLALIARPADRRASASATCPPRRRRCRCRPTSPRAQRRLRLKPAAELAPRSTSTCARDSDRARSHLLHRLALLGIDWGEHRSRPRAHAGTFQETVGPRVAARSSRVPLIEASCRARRWSRGGDRVRARRGRDRPTRCAG